MSINKPYSILIVDDDVLYLKTINHIIKNISSNIETKQAKSGYEAINILEKETPDLIIIDWEMPGMSGIEFIERLQKKPDFHDIPAIVCTGRMTDSENLKTAFDAGAVDFIRKPIDKIELISRVNSMIRLSESYRTIKAQKDEILEEKNKANKLLYSILPKKIARELKETGKTEPELFENVTVFFSDIVGFTTHSTSMEPKELISELNDIFTGFDTIMEKNNCERIKTVGDAYLAVCGMPDPNPDHAKNIIQATIETIDFLNERNKKEKHTWQIRVGINTGDLVGGIVGINKYIYDVFGDTINTASRLESSSEPMKVLISDTTYNLVDKHFKFELPFLVNVKGKGRIKAYYLIS